MHTENPGSALRDTTFDHLSFINYYLYAVISIITTCKNNVRTAMYTIKEAVAF